MNGFVQAKTKCGATAHIHAGAIDRSHRNYKINAAGVKKPCRWSTK